MTTYLGGFFRRKPKFLGPALVCAAIAAVTALFGFQREFRVSAAWSRTTMFQLPADYQEKTEWIFARLMYPQHPRARFGRYYGYRGSFNWLEGGTSWTQDYPRADRHFSMALRRLTRVHVRSVEQPVNLDDGDDVYNWPWLARRRDGRLETDRRRRPRNCATIFCAADS